MAKIRYVTGDLLASDEKMIIHGCNAKGVMNSGIARSLREMYPENFRAYHNYFIQHNLKVGEVVWWAHPDKSLIIGNAITQKNYGRENERYASYDGIAEAFAHVNIMARDADCSTVGLPLLGAGLAKGRWPIISAIIEDCACDFEPVVYLLDGIVPT